MKRNKVILAAVAAMAVVFDFVPVSFATGGVVPSTLTPRKAEFGVEDAALKKTIALPAADGTVDTGAIDIYQDVSGWQPGNTYDIAIKLPVFNATELPNAATIVAHLMGSALADKSNAVELGATVTVIGAGGVGAAAKSARFRTPMDSPQFVFARFVCTDCGDLTTNAKLGTLALEF